MPTNPNQATVRRTLLQRTTIADGLTTLDNVCSAGAQSAEVQASPVAQQALLALQKTVTTAHGSLATRVQIGQTLQAAIKALRRDVQAVRVAVRTYEAAVGALAQGDAAVINKAGLQSRAQKTPPVPLGKVSVVHSKPGKHAAEAILTWPRAPGATGYAIEVNFTPQTPTGPWTAITSGSSRRRAVKGPAPGAQFLVRIASLGSDGTQSEWSDAILATAL